LGRSKGNNCVGFSESSYGEDMRRGSFFQLGFKVKLLLPRTTQRPEDSISSALAGLGQENGPCCPHGLEQ